MGKFEKLIAELRTRPAEAEFADMRRVLEAYGWALTRMRGSHATFKKPGEVDVFTVALVGGRRVRRTYIEQMCELLQLDRSE